MQVLSDRLSVDVSPERLELEPGGQGQITLNVTNQSTDVDQFRLSVDGVDPSWVTVKPDSVNLYPGSQALITILVAVPARADVAATTDVLHLRLASQNDPSTVSVVDLPLTISAVGELTMSIQPQLATAGRFHSASYQVHVTNARNAPLDLTLSVIDDAQQFTPKLAEENIRLGLGESADINLEMNPRHRPWISPAGPFPFKVIALPVTGTELAREEPLAGTDGALQYRPFLAFMAGWPGWLRWLLLALMLLLLLAALAFLLVKIGDQAVGTQATPTPVATVVPAGATAPALQPTTAPATGGTGGAASSRSTPPLPTIDRFELAVDPNSSEGGFLLVFVIKNAASATVDGTSFQPDPATGEINANKPVKVPNDVKTRQFDLEAKNDAGQSVRRSVGLIVLHKPEIKTLSANPTSSAPGTPVTLSWEIDRAARAELNGEAIDAKAGRKVVTPEATTSYKLVAENELGRTEQTIDVTITPAPAQ